MIQHDQVARGHGRLVQRGGVHADDARSGKLAARDWCALRRRLVIRRAIAPGRRRQGAFEEQAGSGLSPLRLAGQQDIGRLRPDVRARRDRRCRRPGRRRRPPAAPRPTASRAGRRRFLGERGRRPGGHVPVNRQVESPTAASTVILRAVGVVVAHLDVQLRAALRAGRTALDPQDRQVRQRLGRGGRFELDLRVGGQRREVGLRPGRALEIADHHQLPPAMIGRRKSGANMRAARSKARFDVHPLRQGAAVGQLVAQGVEVRRRDRRTRPAAARRRGSGWPPARADSGASRRRWSGPARSARRPPRGPPCSG